MSTAFLILGAYRPQCRCIKSDMRGMNAPVARRESRIRSCGCLHLVVNEVHRIEALIYDVSPSGICVETEVKLPLGAAVGIDGGAYTSEGVVRYCGAYGSKYRIGLDLEGTKSSAVPCQTH